MSVKKANKNIVSYVISILLVVSSLMLVSCSEHSQERSAAENGFVFYYITPDIDGVIPVSLDFDPSKYDSVESRLQAVTELLRNSPDNTPYVAPLGENSGFVSSAMDENQAVFDFDENINELDLIRSTLIRAAITRTCIQLSGVSAVRVTVDGQPMLSPSGIAIAPMNADSFIDNAGLQINAEERTQLRLYFANQTGDKLTAVDRTVVYSGNISMDKLVINQLLAGPEENEDAYPVLNPDIKIINVTTQDGTCYVNFDSSFLAPVYNVTNDVIIYSIVNSLAELGNVSRVQFMIDSDSDVMFRESVSLNTQFIRNLDIIE